MRKIAFFGLSLFLVILAAQILFADGGKIPFRAHVKIFEPNQNAMIAWNGEEEILLLSTNVRSSEPTKVLNVVPFPSEPKVKKGDLENISKLDGIIKRSHRTTLRPDRQLNSKISPKVRVAQSGPPVGEIKFYGKIGSHDISVAHILNKEEFTDRILKYLKSAGVDNPEIPEDVQKVVEEYLTDGFNWFVFDVVDVKEDIATTEAIQYQFKTKSLFYPLRISRDVHGPSKVSLLVLTLNRVLIRTELGSGWREVAPRVSGEGPVIVTEKEVEEIDTDMAKLFAPSHGLLRKWEFKGSLSSFTNDLLGDSLKHSSTDKWLERLIKSRDATPLVQAAQKNDLIEVHKLLDVGVGANWSGKFLHRTEISPPVSPGGQVDRLLRFSYREEHLTALQESCGQGFVDIVKLLLERGADANLGTKYGGCPLTRAAVAGRVEVLRVLLRAGASVDVCDDYGRTALHMAAENGYDEVVKLLLENGADASAKTNGGKTALQLAAERGHSATLDLLKSKGQVE